MAKGKVKKRTNRIKEIFLNYVQNHLRDFIIITIVFFIGIVLGVIFVNNMGEVQGQETKCYIEEFIQQVQQDHTIDKKELLKQSVGSNLITTIILWITGCTAIGMPILYGMTCFRGFSLGYTISIIFASLEFKSGLLFAFSTLLLQNITFIPALFALTVSGIELYRSIVKNRAKTNIKMEIYRHTIFSCIIGIIFIASSFIEVYLSTNLFLIFVKYISLSTV